MQSCNCLGYHRQGARMTGTPTPPQTHALTPVRGSFCVRTAGCPKLQQLLDHQDRISCSMRYMVSISRDSSWFLWDQLAEALLNKRCAS